MFVHWNDFINLVWHAPMIPLSRGYGKPLGMVGCVAEYGLVPIMRDYDGYGSTSYRDSNRNHHRNLCDPSCATSNDVSFTRLCRSRAS